MVLHADRTIKRSTADLWKDALRRAQLDKLVPYPALDPDSAGIWEVGDYLVVIPQDPHPEGGVTHQLCNARCSCKAGQSRKICKHAAAAVFAARHGLRPIRPADHGLQQAYGTVPC